MDEPLYYRDPYAREVRTEVLEVRGDEVVLGESVLYPGGGGQPPDEGTLSGDGFLARVVGHTPNSVRMVECDGRVGVGEEVLLSVDWERRYRLMRMHTGEHVLFRALSKIRPVSLVKVSFDVPTGSVFVKGDVGYEDVLAAEREANRVVEEGRRVLTRWVGRGEVSPEVRALLDRIRGDRVRIVEVEGYDLSACSGVHVGNTSEVGGVFVEGVRRRGSTCEIRFCIGEEAERKLREYAASARLAAWHANCDVGDLRRVVGNLSTEVERLRKAVLTLASSADPFVEVCPGVHIAEVPGLDRKAAGELLDRGEGVYVLLSEGERLMVFIRSTSVPAREILAHIMERLGGRGGGGNSFASGYVERRGELGKLICEFLNDRA